LRWVDRALFIWLYRRSPRILDAITIIRPETILRLASKGFCRLLAMEVSFTPGPAADRQRGAGFDLHGAAAGSAIADLEEVRPQSYGGDCVD